MSPKQPCCGRACPHAVKVKNSEARGRSVCCRCERWSDGTRGILGEKLAAQARQSHREKRKSA